MVALAAGDHPALLLEPLRYQQPPVHAVVHGGTGFPPLLPGPAGVRLQPSENVAEAAVPVAGTAWVGRPERGWLSAEQSRPERPRRRRGSAGLSPLDRHRPALPDATPGDEFADLGIARGRGADNDTFCRSCPPQAASPV